MNAFIASGRDRARGAEINLILTPVQNCDVTISYAYVDAKILESVSAGRVGDRPNKHAFHQFAGFARYSFRAGRLKGFYVGGGVRYRSPEVRRYVGDVLDENDGYFLVNGLLGYRWRAGRKEFRVAVNVNNLLDDDYITRGAGPTLGTPRSFAFTIGLSH